MQTRYLLFNLYIAYGEYYLRIKICSHVSM